MLKYIGGCITIYALVLAYIVDGGYFCAMLLIIGSLLSWIGFERDQSAREQGKKLPPW